MLFSWNKDEQNEQRDIYIYILFYIIFFFYTYIC